MYHLSLEEIYFISVICMCECFKMSVDFRRLVFFVCLFVFFTIVSILVPLTLWKTSVARQNPFALLKCL